MTATYDREPMPAHMRATCPLCCRAIQVVATGRMVRHGWHERGRQVGRQGLGFQWGECPGTGDRPLEQTDADGLRHVETLRGAIAQWDAVVALHARGADHYDHEVGVELRRTHPDRNAEEWAKSGLEAVATREDTLRDSWGRERGKLLVTTYRVPRAYAGTVYVGYSFGLTGTYEILRTVQLKKAEHNRDALVEALRMLLAAIEHHRAVEPSRVPEATRRVVHKAWTRSVDAARGRGPRPLCGNRGASSELTEDASKVTCSRCLKSMAAEGGR